jgi:hypothetical protein
MEIFEFITNEEKILRKNSKYEIIIEAKETYAASGSS